MRKAIYALLVAALCASALVPVGHVSTASAAQPSPVPTYCSPPIPILPGHEAKAAEIQSDLQHAEQCSGQYGDVYTDGAFYNPTPQFNGSSLSVIFPTNVFTVNGQRVYFSSSTQSAPSNTTSYWFLDSATGLLTAELTNSPPTTTSELEYTVVSTVSGVSSVSYGTAQSASPVYATLVLSGNATVGDITATNQAGHAGDVAVYDANGKLSASAALTQCPVAGANITVTGVYPCTVAAVTPTPAPTPSPIAGANISITGTYPYTITSTASGGGVTQIVAGQNINLTPTGGVGNVTVAETVTPGPQATPSATPTGCGTWSGSWPYTDDTSGCASLTTANAFTHAQSITYNALGTDCDPISPSELCILGTSLNGFVVGPQSGVWSGGTGNADSQHILFCKQLSGTVSCPESIYYTSGGQLQLSGSTVTTLNQPFSSGTASLTGGRLLQGAACTASGTLATGAFSCRITSASTSTSLTWASAYSSIPVCVVSNETSGHTANCVPTTSGATITVQTSGDVFDVVVVGNKS